MKLTYYCPSCGRISKTRVIESVPSEDETKDVCTCDYCGNIFDVFRFNSKPAAATFGGAPDEDHD